MPVFPDAGSDACPGAVRQTAHFACGPVVGQIRAGQRLMENGCPRPPRPGRRSVSRPLESAFLQVIDIQPDLGGGFRSSCVPLSPAVARTHDGRDSRRLRGLLWASGGPMAGAEGLLDVLAGDLVAAGYAVGVDSERDTHVCPARRSRRVGRRRPATATARHDAGRRGGGWLGPARVSFVAIVTAAFSSLLASTGLTPVEVREKIMANRRCGQARSSPGRTSVARSSSTASPRLSWSCRST